MSQASTNRLWKMTESIRGLFGGGRLAQRKPLPLKERRLLLDSLEERTLLSLSIGATNDVLVNPEWQDIRGNVAVGINASNDVVATWTAADLVTDPVTGRVLGEELNIYARYLTDEVQIVTIPIETTLIRSGGSFSLTYGAAAVQRLSFFTATVPNSGTSVSYIEGTLTLSIDGGKTVQFEFSEFGTTPKENAQALETAIRSLGPAYSQIEVIAYTEREFDITYYGDEFVGKLPVLKIEQQVYSGGFAAGALVETISSPTTITGYNLYTGKEVGITIGNGDAAIIAQKMEAAFNGTLSTALYGPVQRSWRFNPETRVFHFGNTPSSAFSASVEYPDHMNRTFPAVEVKVIALPTYTESITTYDDTGNLVTKEITYYQFQITFTGNSGYMDHQQLLVNSLSDGKSEHIADYTYNYNNDPFFGKDLVETVKESSTVFRVNAPEPAEYVLDAEGNIVYDWYGDPMIKGAGKTDQYSPDVALDNAGNFTIVWESEIKDGLYPHNYTDIYARRFTIQGVVDLTETDHLPLTFYADGGRWNGDPSEYIPLANNDPYQNDVNGVKVVQSVRPLAEEFRVNVETNGTQEAPSISCDMAGNFVITWTTDSQWDGYFAGIQARWFDKTGLAITADITVDSNLPGTPSYGESYVKMGPDGTTLIAWQRGDSILKSVYAPGMYVPFVESVLVAEGAYGPSADFDANGRYVLAWTQANGSFTEIASSDAFSTTVAALYSITHDEQNVYSETELATGDVSEVETGWGVEKYLLSVGNISVGMDANGSIFFVYQGFGHDMQEVSTDVTGANYTGLGGGVTLSWAEIWSILVKTGNEDLAPYFQGWYGGWFADVDSYIAACLASIQKGIRADLVQEVYDDYLKDQLENIEQRYEVRNLEKARIRAEIEQVIVAWYENRLHDKTYAQYASDSTVVRDVQSQWYGRSFAQVVATMASKTTSPWYLDLFTESLRTNLYEFFYDSYPDDEAGLNSEVAYYLNRFIQMYSVVRGNPKNVLDTLIAAGNYPIVDSQDVADRADAYTPEYIRLYMIELEINEALYRANDAITMRVLGYTNGWYNGIDGWVQGRNVWGPAIDNAIQVWNASTEEYEWRVGPNGIKGVDDLVKSDILSSYMERYDELTAAKIAEIRVGLAQAWTYKALAASDIKVEYLSKEQLAKHPEYLGMTYAELTAMFYKQEMETYSNLSPSERYYPTDQEILLQKAKITLEVNGAFKTQRQADIQYYLAPFYTFGGVLDVDKFTKAVADELKIAVDNEIQRRLNQWVLEEVALRKNIDVATERYGDAVNECLRMLPDTLETAAIVGFTARNATQAEYLAMLNSVPNPNTFAQTSPYTLRSLYRWYLLNNADTRADYVDSNGYVDELKLDRDVQRTLVLTIIRNIQAEWTYSLAKKLAEAEKFDAVQVYITQEYFQAREAFFHSRWEAAYSVTLEKEYALFLAAKYDSDPVAVQAKIATVDRDEMIAVLTERDLARLIERDLTDLIVKDYYGTNSPYKDYYDLREAFFRGEWEKLIVGGTAQLVAAYTKLLSCYYTDPQQLADAVGNINDFTNLTKMAATLAKRDVEQLLWSQDVNEFETAYERGEIDPTGQLTRYAKSLSYHDYLYEKYLPIVADAMMDDLYGIYNSKNIATLRAEYTELIRSQYTEIALDPISGGLTYKVKEDALAAAVSGMSLDALVRVLVAAGPEVAARTAEKVKAEIAARTTEILSIYNTTSTTPIYYELITDWILEERVRQRMLDEIMVENQVYRNFCAQGLEDSLREFHTVAINAYYNEIDPAFGKTRRELLFLQYYNYVNSQQAVTLKQAFTSEVRSLLNDMADLPQYLYSSIYNKMKDVDTEKLYLDYLRPQFTDTQGNVNEAALNGVIPAMREAYKAKFTGTYPTEATLAAAVTAAVREEILWTLIYNDIRERVSPEMNALLYEGLRAQEDRDVGGAYAAAANAMVNQYEIIRTFYNELDTATLRNLYRQVLVSQYTNPTELDLAVQKATKVEMVEALAKDNLTADYRGLLSNKTYTDILGLDSTWGFDSFVSEAGVVNRFALDWAVEKATFNDMVAALVKVRISLKKDAVVNEKIEEILGELVYTSVLTWNPTFPTALNLAINAEKFSFYHLFRKIFTESESLICAEQIETDIRLANVRKSNFDDNGRPVLQTWFDEERMTIATQESTDKKIRTKFLAQYTDKSGYVDEWGLDQAVEKEMNRLAQIATEERVEKETVRQVKMAPVQSKIVAHVAKMQSTIEGANKTFTCKIDLFGTDVTINYRDITYSTNLTVNVLVEKAIQLEAEKLVVADLARRVELRVAYDMFEYTEPNSTEAMRQAIRNKVTNPTWAEIQKIARQQTDDFLYNRKDVTIRRETLEHILFDDTYSQMYAENYDRLFQQFGTPLTYFTPSDTFVSPLTYDDLLTDTVSIFIADEFSPFYGKTYAEICFYLTSTLKPIGGDREQTVKNYMLEHIVVPDELCRMTRKDLDYLSTLIIYAETFRSVYAANYEYILNDLAGPIYEQYYAAEHNQLYQQYLPAERAKVYQFIVDVYDDKVNAEVDTLYKETLDALQKSLTDFYAQPSVWQSVRAGINYTEAYNAYWSQIDLECYNNGMEVVWNCLRGSAVWNQYVTVIVDDNIAAMGGPSAFLDNATDQKIAQLITDTVEGRRKVYYDQIAYAAVDGASVGVQPEWAEEDNPIPSYSEAIEARIYATLMAKARVYAASLVVNSSQLQVLVERELDRRIVQIQYDLIDTDPKYQIELYDKLGRCNAVLEYNLRHLRGAANDILFTTFNASFAPTSGDANGVVNSQRDGNNTHFLVAVPRANVGGGTIGFDVGGLVNGNYAAPIKVSVGLVIDDANNLVIGDTAQAIVDAFISSGELNIDAGWYDGLVVRVVTNMRSEYNGTDWAWSSQFTYNLDNSYYWAGQFVVYELIFQGDAHDTDLFMNINLDDSTLTFSTEGGFPAMIEEMNSDEGLQLALYNLLLHRIWTTPTATVNTVIGYMRDFYYSASGSWQTMFGEILSSNELATEFAKILLDAVRNKEAGNFRTGIQTLMNSGLITGANQPTLFSTFRYLFRPQHTRVYTAFFNWFSLNGGTTTVNGNTTFNDLPFTDEDRTIRVYDPVTNTWVETEHTALSFQTRLEDLQTAISDLEDDTPDDLSYEYGLSKYYAGYRGTPQLNPTVGMNDSGNPVVVWQQKSRFAQENYYNGSTYIPVGEVKWDKSTQIYLRSFIEATDYAGAQVTSVVLPNGNRIENGETITTATKSVVVSFTENLRTVAGGHAKLHAVDNVDNWFLYLDGVLVENAIESITFGMSASRFVARTSDDVRVNGKDGNPETLAYGTNQWEAIVTFKDGYELISGNYTLVASNKIQDIAGNAIYARGVDSEGGSHRNGNNFEINFSVFSINKPLMFGTEDPEFINGYRSIQKDVVDNSARTVGDQYTTERLLEDVNNYGANTPNAVACDANGNFVTVWTEVEKDVNGMIISGGIYYQVYRQEYVYNDNGTRILKTIFLYEENAVSFRYDAGSQTYNYYYNDANGIERVLGGNLSVGIPKDKFSVPQQASVAMDDTGNFVLVWDMVMADDVLGKFSRDVYARHFTLAGKELGINGYIGPYRINVETEKDQQNASVAMDSDGDFVIVWESFEQDGSGWGIYGRRFDDLGYSFGSSNSIQLLSFNGTYNDKGNAAKIVFTDIDGTRYTMANIELSPAMSQTCKNIEEAFWGVKDSRGEYVFWNGDIINPEYYVHISRQGANSINIEFYGGKFKREMVEPLQITVYDKTSTGSLVESTKLTANISETAQGSDGTEFRVNDTTVGHQRFAAIGMNSDGTFMVSWTGWGQDADAPHESNIYAKQFVSNHNLRSLNTTVKTQTSNLTDSVTPLVISVDSPANHEATGIADYNGVCLITVGGVGSTQTWIGSGALLTSGIHILTAAHVVWDEANGTTVDPLTVTVTFVTANESFTYIAKEIYVHPSYTSNLNTATETDLAVILLTTTVDSSIQGYDLYRNSDELGQTFTMVGFGEYGMGTDVVYVRPSGEMHYGQNTFDILATTINNYYNPNILMYDFDNGTRAGDVFGLNYGVVHWGLGKNEATTAPGDSGGPNFINGKIAGITSFGYQVYPVYGDIGGSVRVSAYTDWIDGILAGASGSEFLVNFDYEAGIQIWSDVAIDNSGNFVVTWTSYNQDGHGDTASGGTSNGLAGVYMRRWAVTGIATTVYSDAIRVHDYTGNDQAHSKIDMDSDGNFVIVWESYQDRVYGNDLPVATGIYAKRFLNTNDYYAVLVTLPDPAELPQGGGGTGELPPEETEPVETDPLLSVRSSTGDFARIMDWTIGYFDFKGLGKIDQQTGSFGGEFCVNQKDSEDLRGTGLDNQRGGSVALNANGDMVFVWTDENNWSTPDKNDARVVFRSIPQTNDTTPPYVTTVTAAYGPTGTTSGDFDNVSLMGDTVTFAEGHGPSALVYTFSEIMFTQELMKQLLIDVKLNPEEYSNSLHLRTIYSSPESVQRSILNTLRWTLLKNGSPITVSSIDKIYYGYNAGSKLGYTNTESSQYELVITFKNQLDNGVYKLTLSDLTTDLGNNRLDGNYDHVAGGAFTITFNVGVKGVTSGGGQHDEEEDEDKDDLFTAELGHRNPEIVSFEDGSFIVVSERFEEEIVTGRGVDLTVATDIVLRKFDKHGEPAGIETITNLFASGKQTSPDVDGLDIENFGVVWTGEGKTGEGVYARFYSNGSQVSDEIRINDIWYDSSFRSVKSAQIAYNAENGSYLITWLQQEGTAYIVLGRYFRFDGKAFKPMGDQFEIARAASATKSVDSYHLSYGGNRYGVAWSEVSVSTNSTEVYAKMFQASNTWGMSVVRDRFMVNQTMTGDQYEPNTAMNKNGEFFVVWTSTQKWDQSGYDIYTRSFSANGTAKNNETWVNPSKSANEKLGNEQAARISADPNGAGYIITWNSYNTEGVNYDLDNKLYLSDTGVQACVFNASGNPMKRDNDGNWAVSTSVATASFMVNTTINGNQSRAVPSMYAWTTQGPQFVVVWNGPQRVYEEVVEDETGTGGGSGGGTNLIEGNPDYFVRPTVFYRCFPQRTIEGTVDVNNNSKTVTYSSSGSDVSQSVRTDTGSGTGGFYRPSSSLGRETILVPSETSTHNTEAAFTITGTLGNDVLELIVGTNGTSWSAKLNGQLISLGTNVKSIQFDGGGGVNRLIFTGSRQNESITVSGEGGKVSVLGSGISFTGSNLQEYTLDGGGGNDSLTVNTSKGNDTLRIAVGDFRLTSTSRFAVTAVGFAEIIAQSSGGTDTAVLLDSRKDDEFYAKDKYVRFSGDGFKHEVYGFTSVSAVAENGGVNRAVFEQITSLTATENSIIGKTAGAIVATSGFNTITAVGTGNASATLIGSRGDDLFESDATSGKFTWSTGRTISLTGFPIMDVIGNGGNDLARLIGGTGVNFFTGRSDSASLSNGTFTRNLSGFSHVKVDRNPTSQSSVYKAVFYDSLGSDSLVIDQNRATLSIDGHELYEVMAFNQVTTKREKYSGRDTVQTLGVVDTLLENDAWIVLK